MKEPRTKESINLLSFRTDTVVEDSYFTRTSDGNTTVVRLECSMLDLPFLNLQLREWVRQTEVVMDTLELERMA